MADITSMLDGRKFKSWEQDPSTRESLRLFTKRIPIDITLTTAGTAEDLFAVDTGSIATVNLITNPGMETGDPPTDYTAVRSATLAQDSSYEQYGTYSMSVTPPNTIFVAAVPLLTVKTIPSSATRSICPSVLELI